MKIISQIHRRFRKIRWRYLGLLIAVYVLCSIGYELFIGHHFTSLLSTILNDWHLYLTMIIVYIVISIIRPSNSSNES